MKKFLLPMLAVIGFVILFIIVYLLTAQQQVSAPTQEMLPSSIKESSKSADFKGNEDVLKDALNLYSQKKREGLDMASGPCLGKVGNDWVLDIVHNPRQAIDEEAKNQCLDYREGTVKHFIELDENGNLLRAQ